MLYFGEPVGRVKIQEASNNITRYYTLYHLIRDLLSNMFSFKIINFLVMHAHGDQDKYEYLFSFFGLFVFY